MDRTGRRVAGWALVGAAAASVLAMSHHPTSAHAGGLNTAVHAMLIALAGVGAYGFLHWSRLRGLDRPAVAAGLVAYSIALFGGIGAATINGFVMTALVHEGGAGKPVHLFAWEANQALALLGAYATAAAYALWSVDLMSRGPGRAERLVGMAGIVVALVPAALLAGSLIRMNVGGALLVYASQWGWMALVGLLMLREGRGAASA
jgi:hypothetical protein